MLEPEKFKARLHERFNSVVLIAAQANVTGESLRNLFEQSAYDVAEEHFCETPSGPPRSVIGHYEEKADKLELLLEACRNYSGKIETRLQAALLRARKAEADLENYKQEVANGRG